MTRYFHILLTVAATLLMMVSGEAQAEPSPEGIVRVYFYSLKVGDFKAVAAIMDEQELDDFKQALMPVIDEGWASVSEGPLQEAVALRKLVGGDGIEGMHAKTPEAFFAHFMSWIVAMNPAIPQSLAKTSIHTLGHVTEDDMAHVVYRISLPVEQASSTQLNVISLRKKGETWRLMMTREIGQMKQMLQMLVAEP